MLKAENISKKFGKTYAVRNLSFELKKGDITGLLGPNGAGKTTTMRMITSYYFPSNGKITIDDQNTTTHTLQTQKKIGYLPENNPLYLDMLVVDYLEMTAKLNGVQIKNIKNQINKVAKQVNIKSKLLSPIAELSKGFKQRVGIAAALLHDPKIIIMDEPTEGLDPNQREEIHGLIKNLSKERGIMISTHVMQEVKAMCNKVIVINEGELVVAGAPDQLSKMKTLKLKLEGDKDKMEDSLTKLIDTKENETLKISDRKAKIKTVELKSQNELRPEVSKLAAKNNWTIWEMEMLDSLEDVFHKLKA